MSDAGYDPPASGDPLPDPFKNIPLFGDVLRMASQQGPLNWESATQLALSIASAGASEPNVDPLERIRLEELARVAHLHLSQVPSLPGSSWAAPKVVPTTRTAWAASALADYRPLFERLAASLGPSMAGSPAEGSDPLLGMLAPLLKMMSPVMMGMTAGSMVGHLARSALGSYHLPIPRPGKEVAIVVPALAEFSEEWSLGADELRLWVCLHEFATHAVLEVPAIHQTLTDLLQEYAGSFSLNPAGLEDRFAAFEMPDLSKGPGEALLSFQKMLGDPEVLLGAVRSPAQIALQPRLEALVCVVVGWVDHALDLVTPGLLGGAGRLGEALRRRRVEASDADRFVERLFGLELRQRVYDRGSAFIEGVVQRSGEDGLMPLWADAASLPTPAEIEAPGLWLARLELD